MKLNVRERELFRAAADLLIPAGGGMPSASQAGVDEEGLKAVFQARPELEAALQTMLQAGGEGTAQEFLARLREADPPGFGALAEIVAGAYFMNPEVRQALGYGGQKSQPIDEGEEIDPELLKSALERGSIYRPTP